MDQEAGYLTIKERKEIDDDTLFRLDFPNLEVQRGCLSVLLGGYMPDIETHKSWITNLRLAFCDGRTDELGRLFRAFFADIPYSLRPKKDAGDVAGGGATPTERFFHYTFFLIFKILTSYVVLIEKQNAGRRAACIVETDRFVYISQKTTSLKKNNIPPRQLCVAAGG